MYYSKPNLSYKTGQQGLLQALLQTCMVTFPSDCDLVVHVTPTTSTQCT